VLIFMVSAAALIGVSYATPAPPAGQLSGLTFGTVTAAQKRTSRASWNQWDVVASALVLVGIVAAYLYFRG
jgi:SSS family solute:Na+ symporter